MIWAKFRCLETDRLVLRAMRRSDAEDYYRHLASSEAVTRYMLFRPHRDAAESVASVEKTLHRYEMGKTYRWVITRKGEDRLIGVIDLLRLDEQTGEGSFAYMLGEAFWGCGYGTEALKAGLAFAFRDLGLNAVEADHMAENAASGAVMRKAGMVYIRTDAAKYDKDGKRHDAPVYRICREK